MNRIDLSAHCHIEDMDGRRYLVTTDDEAAWQWRKLEGLEVWAFDEKVAGIKRWANVIKFRHPFSEGGEWRILLTDVAPVYEFPENGEPWVGLNTYLGVTHLICGVDSPGGKRYMAMHRRAAAVCDGAEQFRALHAALKEARDQ